MARARRARWAAALAALALAGCATEARDATAPGPDPDPRGVVVTVIDGDTIKVTLDGGTDTVRLLGIDDQAGIGLDDHRRAGHRCARRSQT